jgi:hypothetical protein
LRPAGRRRAQGLRTAACPRRAAPRRARQRDLGVGGARAADARRVAKQRERGGGQQVEPGGDEAQHIRGIRRGGEEFLAATWCARLMPLGRHHIQARIA